MTRSLPPSPDCRCFGHDAASARAAETAMAALSQQAARLKGILETAMDAIITVDDAGQVLLFNHAAEVLLGVAREQALGLPVERFVPPAHRPGHLDRMRQFAQEPVSARIMGTGRVMQAMRADGSVLPVEASISVAMEGDKRLYTVILRDLSERNSQREALVRSNLELQQFAFVASHDMRAPLRSISGFLDLLLLRHGAALDEDARDLIERAHRAVRQLDQLTADLLCYARLQAHARPMAEVDCNAALADAMHMLHATISTTGAQIQAQPLPLVHGDRTQLVQLLQNLLDNAFKYCQGHTPVVKVHAERGAGEWVFHVADNGIGIERMHLERIFEAFHRLHTQREFPGSGIGLAVCRRIVDRHGGRIWCTSTVGEGSTFSFSIPDCREQA